MNNIKISVSLAWTHTVNSSASSIALSAILVSASSVYWKTLCPALISRIPNRSINICFFLLFDKNKSFSQSRSMDDVNSITLDCMELRFMWQWSLVLLERYPSKVMWMPFPMPSTYFTSESSIGKKVLPICHGNLWSSIPPSTTFFQLLLLMSRMTSWMMYCSAVWLPSSFFFESLMNPASSKGAVGYWASWYFKASFWSSSEETVISLWNKSSGSSETFASFLLRISDEVGIWTVCIILLNE